MSWGERSCKHKPCIIPEECNSSNCNVNCRAYVWDGETEPDSKPSTVIDLHNPPEGVEIRRSANSPEELKKQVVGKANMNTGGIERDPEVEVENAPIQVLLIRELKEGMKVAVAIPQPPNIFLHDVVYKVQRIRPKGTIVLKKMLNV